MRVLAAVGAVFCSLAVAAGAWAMHGALDAHAKERLALAALFGFAHGAALVLLAPVAGTRLQQASCWVVAAGTLLFCGSLAGAALAGWPPTAAPFGGTLLILGWLLVAAGILVD